MLKKAAYLSFFLGLAGRLSAATYYVSPTGSNGNPGTLALPWLTIQNAANTAVAGDTVNIEPGTYIENVQINNSGTAGNPITFIGLGALGTVVVGNAAAYSGSPIFAMYGKSYITIQNLDICGESGSGAIEMEQICTNINILNNNIHHLTSTSAFAIRATPFGPGPMSNINISGNNIFDVNTSSGSGAGKIIVLEGNVTNSQILNNTITNCAAFYNGIDIDCGNSACPDHILIQGNVITGLTALGGGGGGGTAIFLDGASNSTVTANAVGNTVGWGIQAGYTVSGPSSPDGAVNDLISNNIVYGSTLSGLNIGTYGTSSAYASNDRILNNTLYHNSSGSGLGEIAFSGGSTASANDVFQNNIVVPLSSVNVYMTEWTGGSAPTAPVFDHNDWYSSLSATATFNVKSGASYAGLAAWQASPGSPDTASISKDPLFVSGSPAAAADFYLLCASPAIDAGTNEAPKGVSVDYAGTGRPIGAAYDMGAYEISCGTTPTPTRTSTKTFSPTATPSPTPSATPTRTPSSTPSQTPTGSPTVSPSATLTRTMTITVTDTPTLTSTGTATTSDTPTLTLTRTPTQTATFTPTVTPSSTLTVSPTATRTYTQTITLSATPTLTLTSTRTATLTQTPSATPSLTGTTTFTASPTNSPGPSATQTDTATITKTSTPTATVSATPTVTFTLTRTATLTPTPTVTSTFTASPTDSPGPSATPTYSPSITKTATPTLTGTMSATSSGTPTISPTSTVTSLNTATDTPSVTPSATATPSLSVTSTQTAASTPTDTPSVTATATLTITFSATPSSSPSKTATLTATASLTQTQAPSFTASPSATLVPTPLALPYHLSITVYNSAGEEVKKLYDGSSQSQPNGFSLSAGLVTSGGSPLEVELNGLLQNGQSDILWNGSNDNGQDISGGIYYIKVEQIDPFGAVVSWTKPVSVLPPAAQQSLDIYNSAGELVAQLSTASLSAVSGTAVSLTDVGFADPGQTTFALSMDASSTGVPFAVKESNGSTATLTWNGLSGQGHLVSSGNYTVQLVDTAAGNATIVTSKGFVILDAPDKSGMPKVLVGPNPLGPRDQELVFSYGALPALCSSAVTIYSLAGEMVARGVGAAGSGKIVIRVGSWPSGAYVADFELRQAGALRSRQLLKLAIER